MLSSSLLALLPLLALTSAAPHRVKRACPASSGTTHTSIAAVEGYQRGGHGNHSRSNSLGTGYSATSAGVSSVAATGAAFLSIVAVETGIKSSSVIASSSKAATSSVAAVASSRAASSAVTSSAVVTSTTRSATATTSTSTSSGSTGGQVGLGWGSTSGSDVASFGGNLAWYFNWALTPSTNMGSLEFVPQVWGSGSVDGFTSDSIPSGTKYILSFNEPDQSSSVGGSDIAASTAATLHQQWTAKVSGDILIGSPAVARGGTTWMDSWVAACAGACTYDFVAFHFYGTDADDLITYAKEFYTTYGKPLWLTEWACKDYSTGAICTEAEVKSFMDTAITWFRGDGADIVQRWSYFGAFETMASGGDPNGLENTDGSANDMGEYYVSL